MSVSITGLARRGQLCLPYVAMRHRASRRFRSPSTTSVRVEIAPALWGTRWTADRRLVDGLDALTDVVRLGPGPARLDEPHHCRIWLRGTTCLVPPTTATNPGGPHPPFPAEQEPDHPSEVEASNNNFHRAPERMPRSVITRSIGPSPSLTSPGNATVSCSHRSRLVPKSSSPRRSTPTPTRSPATRTPRSPRPSSRHPHGPGPCYHQLISQSSRPPAAR